MRLLFVLFIVTCAVSLTSCNKRKIYRVKLDNGLVAIVSTHSELKDGQKLNLRILGVPPGGYSLEIDQNTVNQQDPNLVGTVLSSATEKTDQKIQLPDGTVIDIIDDVSGYEAGDSVFLCQWCDNFNRFRLTEYPYPEEGDVVGVIID